MDGDLLAIHRQYGDRAIGYPAPGKLDYGATPRATPLIYDGVVYCCGAFGHLHAVNIATGKVVWKHDSVADFAAPISGLSWGLCGSPLLAGGKLIYYPGGPEAAIVALDPKTGAVIWKTPGARPSYGSFIAASLGRVEQLIGHDATTLGGWDVATGKRLWTLTPERPNDFNVPTPVIYDDRLIVSTENNGTRMYEFDDSGRIIPKPLATNLSLHPDTHSPVRAGTRLFGVFDGIHCLDLSNKLKSIWSSEEIAFNQYTTAVATDTRLLLVNINAEAVIVDATANKFAPLDRRKLVEDEVGMYAHPAFASGKMYLRTNDAVFCFDLNAIQSRE